MPEDYFDPRTVGRVRNPGTYVGTYPIASPQGGSMLNFQAYQPSFIGRPVDRVEQLFQSDYKQQMNVLDQSSAIDLALASQDVVDKDYDIIIDAKNNIKGLIGEIAESGDHRLAKAKLARGTRDYILDNQLLKNAVEVKAAMNQYDAAILEKQLTDNTFTDADAMAAKAISRDRYPGQLEKPGSKFQGFI